MTLFLAGAPDIGAVPGFPRAFPQISLRLAARFAAAGTLGSLRSPARLGRERTSGGPAGHVRGGGQGPDMFL